MAEALGSLAFSLVSTAMDRIYGKELKDFFKGNHINEGDLQKLKILLLSVATMLSDAEEKQFNDPWVKEWVDKLKNSAYDADDLLDEIVTKARHHTSDYASSLNPFSERLQPKVEGLVERLGSLVEFKDILGLKEGGVGKLHSVASATTSLVDEHRVYGRNDDKEKIADFLLSDNSNGAEVPIVAIVGMEGVGKTTLAQILYNDERVMNHFRSRSWVSVSKNLNMHEITKEVLESFNLCQSNVNDYNGLQIQLKDILAEKRFILVLDGFENENYLDWDIFQRPFTLADHGSRIIVTTRSKRVATSIRADLTHSLPFLSDEATWKLFSSHAFKQNPNEQSRVLTQIGWKIVQRCGGLPLAAVTLGSLLHSKEDNEEWENVCNSTLWDLSRGKNNIFSALISSYVHLPSYLKRCFSYCAIFPRGHQIEKWNLIYLWMAEGLLPQSTMGKRIEDIGEECFEELVSKTFFHRMPDYYLMHNLMHELAQCVAGEFCYKLEDSNPSSIKESSVRYVSYFQGIYDDTKQFDIYSACEQMRTFLPFKFSPVDELKPKIPFAIEKLLSKPKRLRVFSLARYPIELLPSSIGDQMHLRHLDLSETLILSLPDSIVSLYNLETLLLVGCTDLTLLPTNTSKLVNLRQLDIRGSGVEKMPTNLGKLNSLQLLPCFVVGDDGGSNVSELGDLLELHGSLSIVNLQNVVSGEEASNVGLKSKNYLREVEFRWTTPTHNQESENTVLDLLEPHPNIRRLLIHNFGGDKFPSWLGSSSISKMVFLNLDRCESCLSLPSLGNLSCLTELHITAITSLQKVGPEFYGNGSEAFSSLRIIKFMDMPNWEEWSTGNQSGSEGFTLLQELYIEGCPKLTGKLPEILPSLAKLVITSCPALSDSMPRVPKLRELELTECKKLQLFHPQMLIEVSQRYSVLKRLCLKRCCDSLISFQLALFPKLEDLSIEDCSGLLTILSDENSLPFLRKLKLKNCSKLTLSSQGVFSAMTSLTSLHINGLPMLTSLERIGIERLTSLHKLKIQNCEKFESLPLVTSLSHLTIKGCPRFKTQCETDTGKYMDMLSGIPVTHIEE